MCIRDSRSTNCGEFELITQISGSNNAYNDNQTNVTDNFYEYYVAFQISDCLTDPFNVIYARSNNEYINPNLGSNYLTYLENTISLFPNPTSGQIQLIISNDIEVINVRLYNVIGQQIAIATNKTIEISFLPSGLYYLQIDTNLGTITKTVIRK